MFSRREISLKVTSQREFSLKVTSQIEKNLCKLDGSKLRPSSAFSGLIAIGEFIEPGGAV